MLRTISSASCDIVGTYKRYRYISLLWNIFRWKGQHISSGMHFLFKILRKCMETTGFDKTITDCCISSGVHFLFEILWKHTETSNIIWKKRSTLLPFCNDCKHKFDICGWGGLKHYFRHAPETFDGQIFLNEQNCIFTTQNQIMKVSTPSCLFWPSSPSKNRCFHKIANITISTRHLLTKSWWWWRWCWCCWWQQYIICLTWATHQISRC